MPSGRVIVTQYTKYPITSRLVKTPAAWRSRSNIVSPELCDDVIRRLAPSLAQHVGCTIIDFNPGIGLWSSKLHDFLKPKSHILMEPKQDIFHPYLKPLLEAPGSRYVFRDWADGERWKPEKFIEEGLIPPPEEQNEKEQSPILIIANLATQAIKPGPSREPPTSRGLKSHIKAIDLAQAIRSKSLFQAHGYAPTRVLMWLPDAEKRALVPRTVGYRGKLAVYMESTCHIEEIAGAPPSLAKIRRENHLETQSSEIVAERMKEDGTQLPSSRQPDDVNTNTDNDTKSSTTRIWHAELLDLEEAFKNQRLSQFAGEAPGPLVALKGGKKSLPLTPEYKRMKVLRSLLDFHNKTTDKLNQILQKQEEIDKLRLQVDQEGTDTKEKEQTLNAVNLKIKAWKDEVEALNSKDTERLYFIDDDRKAFAQRPPLLSWDRRRADPLIVQPDEFYYPKELALLDFQPLPPEQQYPLTADQSIYFDLITTSLFGPRGFTTIKHLNHIAPGAYDALVPQCPALTDPTKGGRVDVENLRVRNLTPEMLWQLAVAWDKWLFKPNMSDLLSTFGFNPNESDMKLRRGMRN